MADGTPRGWLPPTAPGAGPRAALRRARRAARAAAQPEPPAAGPTFVRAARRAAASATAPRSGRSSLGITGARAAAWSSLGSLFLLTLPLLDRRLGARARARGQLESGATTQGEGQATAALWLGRIGVIAGVAALVVFIALLASGFDFEQFRDDLERELDQRRERQDGGDARRRPHGIEQLGRSARRRRLAPLVTPNPFIKQYLMTAGPTPVPPAVSQAMADADALPPRAGVRRALRARARPPARASSPPRNPVLAFAASGTGRAGVRRRQPRATRHEGARARRPASSASAGSSSARPTAPTSSRTSPAGARASTRRGRPRCSTENPGVEVVFGTLQRDLDRHRARHPGDRRGRCAATTRCWSSTPSRASAPRACCRTSGASTWSSPARRRR